MESSTSYQDLPLNSQRVIGKMCLAPMVRMNTLPFRDLALEYGADLVFSEEIVDRKFLTCVRVENELLGTIDYVTARDYSLVLRLRNQDKGKFILQIGTNDKDLAVAAVEKLLPDISGVDVNMGCPKKFSVQGGMGAALMRNPDNAESIMKALVDKFSDKISVSCKIRVLKTFEETLKYVLSMQATGINWISIHPRTAAEESRVPARWFVVKRILETGLIKIPVLGSGDLFSPLDISKYLSFSGASGVIVARGAIHNPAIFGLKEKIFDLKTPLIEDTSDDKEDWKDNCLEPCQEAVAAVEEPIVDQPTKKGRKGADEGDESIEFSTNLVKVYESRYARMPMESDVIEQVRQYFRLSIKAGNHYQNTKYCIMYMLKTHKHHYDLFKQIHSSKTLADYARALSIPEAEFIHLEPAYIQHFEGTFYRKNKHIIDAIAQKEALQVVKQPGFDPDNTGHPQGKGVGEVKIVGTKRSESDERIELEAGKRVKTDEDKV